MRGTVAQWQQDIWAYYDQVGELKFTVTWLGNVMSKLRVFAAARPEDPSDPPVPIEETTLPEQLVSACQRQVERLRGALGGTTELLRMIETSWELPGECWLVGFGERRDSANRLLEAERWEVRSQSAVQWKSSKNQDDPNRIKVVVKDSPDDKGTELELGENGRDTLIRLWMRHPEYPAKADSLAAGVMDDMDAIRVLQMQIKAEGYSRLSAGALTLPAELSQGSVTTDPDEDPLVKEIAEALLAPTEKPGDPRTVLPAIIRGPNTALTPDVLRRIEFGRGDGLELEQRIEMKVQRLARGLHVPPEVTMGHQQTTYANAEQVNEDVYEKYLEPRAIAMMDALTVGYFRPNLEEEGWPPEVLDKVLMWFDPSALLASPDQEDNADGAFDRMVISQEAYRRHKGFTEDDAPTPEEQLARTALRRGQFGPDATLAMIQQYVDATFEAPEPAPAAEGPPALPEPPPPNEPVPLPEVEIPEPPEAAVSALGPKSLPAAVPPERGRHPLGRQLGQLDRELRLRLLAAAEAAMDRALERAGNRAKGRRQFSAQLRGVGARDACATVGGRALQAAGLQSEQLLEGAWDLLHAEWVAWVSAAQTEALTLIGQVLGWDDATRRQLQVQQRQHLAEGWAWLRDGLQAIAEDLLFNPGQQPPMEGEFDATARIPPGLVRQALAIAGGGRIELSRTAAGELQRAGGAVFVALTRGGTEPAGGVATGELMNGAMGDSGMQRAGWRWVYGPGVRTSPFEPHRALDGVEFENFDDPVLVNAGSFPLTSYYIPGDHAGCQCDVEPILLPPSETDLERASSDEEPAPPTLTTAARFDPNRSELAGRLARIVGDDPDYALDTQKMQWVGKELEEEAFQRMGFSVSQGTWDDLNEARIMLARSERYTGDAAQQARLAAMDAKKRAVRSLADDLGDHGYGQYLRNRIDIDDLNQQLATAKGAQKIKLRQRLLDLRTEEHKLLPHKYQFTDNLERTYLDMLTELRDMGGEIKYELGSGVKKKQVQRTIDALEAAQERLPSDWIAAGSKQPVRITTADSTTQSWMGGWYKRQTRELFVQPRMTSREQRQTALHEYLHHLQDAHPVTHQAENAYFKQRIAGDANPVKWQGGDGRMQTWRDEWGDAYAGVNSTGNLYSKEAQELLTRYVADFLTVSPLDDNYDQGAVRWALAVLATV